MIYCGFKRRMEDSGLTLRQCRLRDLRILYSLFAPEISLEASGAEFKGFGSSFSFARWLMVAFQAVYLIEVEESDEHRIIGFAGFYNMKIGRSLWLSLTIFNPEDRRKGYGRKAIELLLNSFGKSGAAETVYAGVLKTNEPSLRFLGKLGFEICGNDEGRFFLLKNLKRT